MANLSGSYRPTSRTIGHVGDVYTNNTTGDRFKCVDIHEIVTDEVTYYYVWTEMRSGGSSGGGNSGGALPNDTEQLNMLIETDMLPAVHDASGAILTDQNGSIILRY